MDASFKRINFFKGLFTTAEDWQAVEEYHNMKRRLHNQYLHGAGIVEGCLEEYKVTSANGGAKLRIGSGLALDGKGRELYLPTAIEMAVDLHNYKRPVTLYVTMEVKEQEIEPRANPNDNYAGHAFIAELPVVTITTEQPDNKNRLELARIALTKETIGDAADVRHPGENEIDATRVLRIGASPIEFVDDGILTIATLHGNDGKKRQDRHPSEADQTIFIGRFDPEAPPVLYLADVYPIQQQKDDGGIAWRIQSFLRSNRREYHLYVTNFSTGNMKVAYRIYRIRPELSQMPSGVKSAIAIEGEMT